MDRRVFQPREDNSVARRRSAIGMALAVLVGSWLALQYLKANPPAPQPTSPRNEVQTLHVYTR